MALFFDRLHHATFKPAQQTVPILTRESYDSMTLDFKNLAKNVDAVVECTNVAEFMLSVDDGEYNSPETDFPNISPPFSTFWVEFANPRTLNVGGKLIEAHPSQPARWGALVRSKQVEGIGWELSFAIAGELPSGVAYYPLVEMKVYANEDGSVREGIWPTVAALPRGAYEELPADFAIAQFMVRPMLLALSFMHCKNVIVTDNEGRYANRQERRAAERRGDPPLVTYKTLQIEPMKKVLATEGDIERNGLAKALHICRGHFAEYGPEFGKGKLFGKYEGRFYVPAHVRGNADQGVVHKRYNVKAPKEDAA